jgi:hypothetical protein
MKRKKPKSTEEYAYGEVEAAIAEVLGVSAENIGTLRARLRALRGIGVPMLPKPGSGRRISYSPLMAFEMLLTLELDYAGFPPRVAMKAVSTILEQRLYSIGLPGEDTAEHFVIVETPERGGQLWVSRSDEALLKMIKDYASDSFILLKITVMLRKLDAALERATATRT